MKILVIGSGGQLGSDCMTVLGNDHEVSGMDFPDIDIGERSSVEQAFEQTTPDCVINCAAYTAVDKCETEKELAWKINGDGPGHIAAIAGPAKCRVVHISTDYVFDGNREVPNPYLEGDPVNPLSEYGRSKLAGELATARYSEDSVILRTAWLYSAHGPNFLKTMLRLALSQPQHPFQIVDDQYGSLTWSHTLARQIQTLLERPLRGVIHTTSRGYSSWYQAASYFLERMAVPHSFIPCSTEDYPTPAHRPANSILENSVLEKDGSSVFTSWQEDVDRFVDQFRDRLIAEAQTLINNS
ncbi:MAG: dTDP-4-dehydrorhamnose reductase [Desulfocapsaceae bacterium]|jgi:dTDP-4-dehydrorhamnose reductase|nr:dTDP-4-dehydrorhamnose reductase [Desulfocapsaceae bacterium]